MNIKIICSKTISTSLCDNYMILCEYMLFKCVHAHLSINCIVVMCFSIYREWVSTCRIRVLCKYLAWYFWCDICMYGEICVTTSCGQKYVLRNQMWRK